MLIQPTSIIDREQLVIDFRLKAKARGLHGTPEAVSDALRLSSYADRLVEEDAQRTGFPKYLRGEKLDDIELKSLSGHTGPDGGFLAPAPIIRELLRLALVHSPIRQYATVRTLTNGSEYPLPKQKTRPQTVWKNELDQHSITSEMTFGGEVVPIHDLVSTIAMSGKTADDPALTLEERLISLVLDACLVDEGTAFVVGNGIGRPEGLLTHPGITTVNSGHASQVTGDGITSLYFKLPQAFRRNGVWLMNGTTIEVAKKLKDTDGAYIFREGLFGLVPDTIHGRPVVECPDMPDIAAGTTPILFGDLSRYLIVDRQELRVLRDIFSAKPMVIFDCVRRVGGQVVDATAFRKQIIAA